MTMHIPNLAHAAKGFVSRFRHDRRGNVLMIMGLSLIPITFATGMTIDYSQAARLQTKMNSAADAAALAAVTQPMMDQSDAAAKTAAINMFNTQIAGLRGVIYNPGDLTVTITSTTGANNSRTAVVSYKAQSANSFAGILGQSTIAIGGSSQSYAATAPNIDFYLMLDASQSMLLPATTSGLTAMKNATLPQVANNGVNVGCAFACHQTWRGDAKYPGNGNKDPLGNANEIRTNPLDPTDPTKKRVLDNYQVARSLGIVLRSDLLIDALKELVDVAKSTSAANKASYRMGLSSFDFDFQTLWPAANNVVHVDADLDRVKTHATDYSIKEYYVNNWRTASNNDGDKGTASSEAFTGITQLMPVAPGKGTKIATDTPQAILFLITDGMRDEFRSGGRPEGPIDTTLCTTIKTRGIRIAVLYTEYLPDSANDIQWSVPNVKTPYLSPTDKISPALSSCASPGLFYKVSTDDDISAALNKLFLTAVATARLTQ